ncbi:hypothetical protein EXS73_01615 [Candidatus Pacearchaeota archaeon]|nr:hypothetical protein [Candidatus Pacearchaeota archaeon]
MALSVQEQARADAHAILVSFGKTLAKVKLPKVKEAKVTQNSGMRVEGMGKKADPAFRKGVFANAPQHDEEYLLAETKEW